MKKVKLILTRKRLIIGMSLLGLIMGILGTTETSRALEYFYWYSGTIIFKAMFHLHPIILLPIVYGLLTFLLTHEKKEARYLTIIVITGIAIINYQFLRDFT